MSLLKLPSYTRTGRHQSRLLKKYNITWMIQSVAGDAQSIRNGQCMEECRSRCFGRSELSSGVLAK